MSSLYKTGSLLTFGKEISNYKLHFVGVQEVRWEKNDTEPAGEYTIFYGKRNESHVIDTGSFVRKRIMSAVTTAACVSDRISYIILRGRWCDIIVLNVHAPTKDKIDDTKDRYLEELDRIFDKFPKYHMNILLGVFNAEVGREDIFKPRIGNQSLHEIRPANVVKGKVVPLLN
jgi:hypothetical protein